MKNLCATTTTAAGTTISLTIDTTASIWHIVTSLYATNTFFRCYDIRTPVISGFGGIQDRFDSIFPRGKIANIQKIGLILE